MLKQAMILAAGLGTRMRELTKDQPKPLIKIRGAPIICHIIKQLLEYGVERIVINAFYKAEMLEEHVMRYISGLDKKLDVKIVHESTLLETGGGVVNMLPYMDNGPFFVVNGDAMWYGPNVFEYLVNQYKPEVSKICLLLTTKDRTLGYRGNGDFFQNSNGTLLKQAAASDLPYVYAGAHISNPEIFASCKLEKFGLMSVYRYYNDDKGEFGGIMSAGSSDIYFLHVGDKEAVEEVEDFLSNNKL